MSVKVSVQDCLSQVELFKPKVATLVSSVSSFQPTDGPDKALKIHNEALAVKDAIEKMKPYAINVQRPVSVADGNTALQVIKELQKSWNTVLDNAIKKKPYIDALPVGNISALLAQDLKLTYDAMLSVANPLIDAAPAELLAEGKATKKEFEDSIKKVLAVYQ
ncbi:hypothetical protein D9756_000992 [Leucocoprinus leucothites]|uniref:Uncharacterized protein n=1 Tax=Leucocoprinus leucothites TaxID=201217 RepID=A0A8H5GER5_9AGAR|nr:hypothetical protein D9756_000992 [Leucoagaricus leucothites]